MTNPKGRFGTHGGQYIPETLMNAVIELEEMGTRNCSARRAGVSGLIFQRAGSLMVFLELQREAGICSRVTAGVDIKNFRLFSDVGAPI